MRVEILKIALARMGSHIVVALLALFDLRDLNLILELRTWNAAWMKVDRRGQSCSTRGER